MGRGTAQGFPWDPRAPALLFFFFFCRTCILNSRTTQLGFQLLVCVSGNVSFDFSHFNGATPNLKKPRVQPMFPSGRSQNIIVLCMPGEDLTQNPRGTKKSTRRPMLQPFNYHFAPGELKSPGPSLEGFPVF